MYSKIQKQGFKMNWKILIEELINKGMTEKSIAEAVGDTTQPTIHRLKATDTPEPKYSLGKRLINLHKEKFAA